VAVVRVSGPDAHALAHTLARREIPETGFALRRLYHPAGDFVDEALVLAFKAPNSYTGEDVVEFQCHGGAVTPRRVLEACFAAGARLARRGEFTLRAFLNGKLDYDQAESVIELIDAKTARSADAALAKLSGGKLKEHRELYEQALSLSAEVEHSLDIDEGELPEGFFSSLSARAQALHSRLSEALRRANEGRILRDGALVVLAGPPNVGKSSLMNALLEANRAIVSDIPGTTRDSIEEWIDIDGYPVRLVDTAGLRSTSDVIEAEGVRRTRELISSADVILSLYDGEDVPEAIGANEIQVRTKCDLSLPARKCGIAISAKTGEGLAQLKQALGQRLSKLADNCERTLSAAPDELVAALSLVPSHEDFKDGADLVLIGNKLRFLADKLGELVGATYSEDLLENLFSRFCVGK
jgi:tRNA modification GTPase